MNVDPKATNKYGYAVLAGGSGTRMGGVNKAALKYNGRTFLDRICSEMEKANSICYLSVADHKSNVPNGWTEVVDVLTDTEKMQIGPMGGICSCLLKAKEAGLSGVFFAPCDTPLYTLEIHRKLEKYIEPCTDAVCFRTDDGRMQMTLGWYSVKCIPALREASLSGEYKLSEVMSKASLKCVDAAESGLEDSVFLNVNSTSDYRDLKGSRHIIICGKKQVGKTTLVNKVITDTRKKIYGFVTKAAAADKNGVRHIYMYPACENGKFEDGNNAENCIGDTCRKILRVNTETFDHLGVSLIRDADQDGILIMDELGYMEENTKAFCSSVLAAFDSDIPILATMKDTDKTTEFLENLRNHTQAEVLMINEKNRDELYRYIRSIVRTW